MSTRTIKKGMLYSSITSKRSTRCSVKQGSNYEYCADATIDRFDWINPGQFRLYGLYSHKDVCREGTATRFIWLLLLPNLSVHLGVDSCLASGHQRYYDLLVVHYGVIHCAASCHPNNDGTGIYKPDIRRTYVTIEISRAERHPE